jgi:hypothetical protein
MREMRNNPYSALAYTAALASAACLGFWLADGSTAWLQWSVTMGVIALTQAVAARVWEKRRR